MVMEIEMKEEEGNREIYNLRSRVVSFTPPEDRKRVSKYQKKETAKSKEPEDGANDVARVHGSTWQYAPPPLTGRRLKNSLKQCQRQLVNHCTKALFAYNKGRGKLGLPRYMLVETVGLEEATIISACLVFHFNFKARPKHDPNAPVELFFGELLILPGRKATQCFSLGVGTPDPATVGREACHYCCKIYHPRDKEFKGSTTYCEPSVFNP